MSNYKDKRWIAIVSNKGTSIKGPYKDTVAYKMAFEHSRSVSEVNDEFIVLGPDIIITNKGCDNIGSEEK